MINLINDLLNKHFKCTKRLLKGLFCKLFFKQAAYESKVKLVSFCSIFKKKFLLVANSPLLKNLLLLLLL